VQNYNYFISIQNVRKLFFLAGQILMIFMCKLIHIFAANFNEYAF